MNIQEAIPSKTNEMIEALETLVINKAKSMEDKVTSSEEIVALSELVKAVNEIPRTLEAFDLKESIAVSTRLSKAFSNACIASKKKFEYMKLRNGNHKRCPHCNEVIHIKNNYCCYCGAINTQ